MDAHKLHPGAAFSGAGGRGALRFLITALLYILAPSMGRHAKNLDNHLPTHTTDPTTPRKEKTHAVTPRVHYKPGMMCKGV